MGAHERSVTEFTLYQRLVTGLDEAAKSGRVLYELVLPDRPLIEDISGLPASAAFLRTRGTPAPLERLTAATGLTALWASRPGIGLLRATARLPRLRAAYLHDLGPEDIEPLAGSGSLQHLLVSRAPHQIDLSCLAAIPALRTLYLDDLKRVDLETLPPLQRVTALHLAGGMWSTLKVASLAPIERLPGLRYLTLANVRPADGSLAPLAKLRRLRELQLPNFLAVEEHARLAAALPSVSGRALTPFFAEPAHDPRGDPVFPCGRCGRPRAMMTGRPAARLCPACDATKIARRVARWEVAFAAGSRPVS
jgi:hypothetical protein